LRVAKSIHDEYSRGIYAPPPHPQMQLSTQLSLARTCATGCIRNVYVSTYVQYFQRDWRVWHLCTCWKSMWTRRCAVHIATRIQPFPFFVVALIPVFCVPHLYYFSWPRMWAPRLRASSISTAVLLKKHFCPRCFLVGIVKFWSGFYSNLSSASQSQARLNVDDTILNSSAWIWMSTSAM